MIDITLIEKYAEPLNVKRKGAITNIGCRERYLYYIQKGLVRKYGYDDEGKEVTCDFVWEGDVVNSYESYVLGTPSRLKVEAVTDCVLYRFNRDMREKFIMASSNEEIAKLMDMIESTCIN